MKTKYFITQYNFLRLFNGLASKYEIQNKSYYKYEIEEFKDEDRTFILFIRLFLESPLDVSNQLIKIKNTDNFSFLFPPTSPAYHLDRRCTSLLKEYYNCQLPEGIKGYPDRVEICRHLFKEQLLTNSGAFTRDSKKDYKKAIDGLVQAIKVNEYFRNVFAKDGLSIESLKTEDFIPIEKRNSFSSSLKFIEQEIDNLYEAFKDDYKKSAKQKGYKRPQAFRLEAVNVFKRNYREKILKLIIDFTVEQLNPNLEFNKEVLNGLGFHSCSNCLENDNIIDEVHQEQSEKFNNYKEKIEELFDMQSFGKFSPINTRTNPLRTIEDIKAASEGAYYCLHKFRGNLQIVFRLPEGKWVYADLPKQENGRLIMTDLYEAYIGKRKNLSVHIRGVEKKEIVLLPLNEV